MLPGNKFHQKLHQEKEKRSNSITVTNFMDGEVAVCWVVFYRMWCNSYLCQQGF
jgi:hypothetical protein